MTAEEVAAQFAISIHTSAREVTANFPDALFIDTISIHTSAREVTTSPRLRLPNAANFNPHFRKGSDSNIPQKHLSIFMKYL